MFVLKKQELIKTLLIIINFTEKCEKYLKNSNYVNYFMSLYCVLCKMFELCVDMTSYKSTNNHNIHSIVQFSDMNSSIFK